MKIETINITKILELNFRKKIINKAFGILIVPIIIFVFLIVLPIAFLYSKVKELFFGKEEIKEKEESIFFENEKYKFVRQDIEYQSENRLDNIAKNFLWQIADYDDVFWIFKLESKKEYSDLVNYPFTNFKIETPENLYLQRINEKDNLPNSELIVFSKINGEIKVLQEIGQFCLEKYNPETQTILGENKFNRITIKVNELN
ncbi:hypothetical protein PG593_05470 [Riemerella anatipestifer]|nr:hypothetical protein [Riemerella anatipestifer]